MAMILNGRELAASIRDKVKTRIETQGLDLGLAVILVGDDPASHLYVSLKQKACEEVGIRFELNLYNSDIDSETIISKIEELNSRNDIHGILVQLPLPNQDPNPIIATIDPNKDVDGFHPKNIERLESGKPGIAPALELGIMKLIDHALKSFTETEQKELFSNAAIVGSELFARPLTYLLNERNISVKRFDPVSSNLASELKNFGIAIVAVGKPNFITADTIAQGAIVIDVGTTREGKRIVGDVDAEGVKKKAGALTPVPGGVGPMTVAMLLLNVLKAHQLQS